VLSPILLSVFLDSIICKLRTSGYGACIGSHYFGCLLYADNIMLVSHSVYVMQTMLDICCKEAVTLDFTFNTKNPLQLEFVHDTKMIVSHWSYVVYSFSMFSRLSTLE